MVYYDTYERNTMLFIPIIDTNLDIIIAMNDGVQPLLQINKWGGVTPTYLVITPGKASYVISHNELLELRKTMDIRTTMRKFQFAA